MMEPQMSDVAAAGIIRLLEGAAIDVWLDGGWAVDALLGEQTRPHRDVDLIVPVHQLPKLRVILAGEGFTIRPGGTPANFVFADRSGLEIDVHAITFDAVGNGVYQMENGQEWQFPASGFAGRGTINGMVVRCLSAEVQVQCHAQGYVPAEKDLRDMEQLRRRFGVELPPQLRRDAT